MFVKHHPTILPGGHNLFLLIIMKVSLIITSKNEPLLVARAIKSAGRQLSDKYDYEILVIAPDAPTRAAARQCGREFGFNLRVLSDPVKARVPGKPAALNLAFSKCSGDYILLTDGDVYLDKYAVKNLLKKFSDPRVGIVSGRIVPVNNRSSMLGYWAHLLSFVGAHRHKVAKAREQKFFGASGYFYGLRRQAVVCLPENSLDDAVLSALVYQKGFRIAYAKNARVLVVFPTTLSDWYKQKVRNLVGNIKMRTDLNLESDRTVTKEAREGLVGSLRYARNWREGFWTMGLLGARLFTWLRAYWISNVQKAVFMKTWVPIQSTKR